MEILPGLHVMQVAKSEFMGVFPPNVYVAMGRNAAALIDTGYDKAEELTARERVLQELGNPPISHIILTHRHRDHVGGAAHLHRATGGTITCAAPERSAVEEALNGVGVGEAVEDGERLDLGGVTLEFIYTPGHTSGSMCILLREHRALFTGDTILGAGTTVINPASDGDMARYLESLHRLLGYDAALICPGHGPMVWNPRAKITELINHRLEREQQIVELLHQGPCTLEGLLKAIYPELDQRLHEMATWQVQAHLDKLVREGRVRQHGGDPATFEPVT